MNFYFHHYFINETLQVIALQFENLTKFVVKIGTNCSELTTGWKSPIEFTSLQWALFKLLSVLLLLTSFIIFYSWNVYGKVITDKFVRPSEYFKKIYA